jgi:8-oxo-dGTP diphosphatase
MLFLEKYSGDIRVFLQNSLNCRVIDSKKLNQHMPVENVDKFFKSAFSVDNVIFGFDDYDLKVLLIKRGQDPYKGLWALPGDLVRPDEDIDSAAYRVLGELTGIENVFLEQILTFGKVNRHPLGRVITISYLSLIKISNYTVTPSSFANQAEWHSLSKVKELAFDHNEILEACFQKLKRNIRIRPIGFELLPPKFTLTELQHLYEAILQSELDKRNFRKKILSMHFIEDVKEIQAGVAHRPARLYKFDKNTYESLLQKGFSFEI